MSVKEMKQFARDRIQPLGPGNDRYRCCAYLIDGTYLPCVVLENPHIRVNLALRRLEESRLAGDRAIVQHSRLVRTFVASGNTVNDFDLKSVDVSPYAIPVERLMEIRGETSMSWTEFTVVMDDDMEFPFGTTFLMEFFEMPEGYSAQRIKRVIPHEIGKPKFRSLDSKVRVYRERPFFTCYIDEL